MIGQFLDCLHCATDVPWPDNVCSECAKQHGGEKVSEIDQTLAERGTRYGEFPDHAKITQSIKRAMENSKNWPTLSDDKKEALEMIAHKIGRVLNGDPDYHDSWHDIIGYTKLVADRLEH